MGGEGELIFALPSGGMPIWRMKSRRTAHQQQLDPTTNQSMHTASGCAMLRTDLGISHR
jgi:hypothetical protein